MQQFTSPLPHHQHATADYRQLMGKVIRIKMESACDEVLEELIEIIDQEEKTRAEGFLANGVPKMKDEDAGFSGYKESSPRKDPVHYVILGKKGSAKFSGSSKYKLHCSEIDKMVANPDYERVSHNVFIHKTRKNVDEQQMNNLCKIPLSTNPVTEPTVGGSDSYPLSYGNMVEELVANPNPYGLYDPGHMDIEKEKSMDQQDSTHDQVDTMPEVESILGYSSASLITLSNPYPFDPWDPYNPFDTYLNNPYEVKEETMDQQESINDKVATDPKAVSRFGNSYAHPMMEEPAALQCPYDPHHMEEVKEEPTDQHESIYDLVAADTEDQMGGNVTTKVAGFYNLNADLQLLPISASQDLDSTNSSYSVLHAMYGVWDVFFFLSGPKSDLTDSDAEMLSDFDESLIDGEEKQNQESSSGSGM